MDGIVQIAWEVLTPIFLIVGLAALYARRFNPDPRGLSELLFYIFIPFLALDGLMRTDFATADLAQIGALVVVLSGVMAGVGWGVARLLGLPRKTTAAFILVVMIMNAANYGLPVNEFAFGVKGANVAVMYYVMSAVVSNTAGVFIASQGSVSLREALLNMFRVPLTYATILGLVLHQTQTELPLPVARSVTLLAQAAIPGMLVLLGFQLSRLEVHGKLVPVLVASGLRLVLGPLVALGLALALGLEGLLRDVAIVESAMPSAVITGVLATKYDSDAAFTTATILVSTLASIVTLSIILSILM